MENKIFQINKVYPEGEKWIAVAVEYSSPIEAGDIPADAYTVENRKITRVYPNDAPQTAEEGKKGCFVILELSPEDEMAPTVYLENGEMWEAQYSVSVRQVRDIPLPKQQIMKAWEEPKSADCILTPVVDDFRQNIYSSNTFQKELTYYLYLPEDYNESERYPLVLFVPDRSVLGKEKRMVLRQGNGAVVWAEDSEQTNRSCIVLVPQFEEVPVEKSHVGNDWLEVLAELVRMIVSEYAVDRNRIYGTGQSMGCMTCIELGIRYPSLFQACFLVAGQWNPQRMLALRNNKLFILVSQGDERALNGMTGCLDYMESQGAKICRKQIETAVGEKQNEQLRELLSDECNIKFAVVKSEITAISCHMDTWKTAYSIPLIREWLFKQR
ncbi:MAG: hypothetical protein LIO94_07630 [Clostridiales bacterium]|nr:hypothetical protein [Clostridiales bacterium]